jgi:N-acetylmuramate 1-kinase
MMGDASFRRYYRLTSSANSYVVMDAPPPQESCHPYVAIAKALRKTGLIVPEIIKENIELGFLLITDFGDTTYLHALNAQNADQLYQHAFHALSILQTCRQVPEREIPPFTADFMQQEWGWHKEWFLEKLLGLTLKEEEKNLDDCYNIIVASAISQSQVFMHRDYHSANLMVLPNNVGILDFQDAFIGPITYDLVSLLRDCYIDWPPEKVKSWTLDYLRKLQLLGLLTTTEPDTFLRWFDLMGLQRHLKALLTFARKQCRDQQSRYLNYIPRTLNYVINTSQHYPELNSLHDYFIATVKPTFERKHFLCEP